MYIQKLYISLKFILCSLCLLYRHKRVADEEKISDDLKLSYTQRILDHVLYDVENCQALRNFDAVKMNTHCTFARTAVLWGARDYDNNLSIEANVER